MNVSEQHTDSIVRVEEQATQNREEKLSRHGVTFQKTVVSVTTVMTSHLKAFPQIPDIYIRNL